MLNSNQYCITPFSIDDYADACDLWKSAGGVTLNESDSVEAIKAFVGRNPGYSYTVRTHQGECVGTVLCGHNGRAGQLYHLTVKADHRGQGIASKLVNLCFQKLKADGIPRCNIFVYNDNLEGNQFWLNTEWHDPQNWKVMQKFV